MTREAFDACKETARLVGFRGAQKAASLGIGDLSKCELDELSGLLDEASLKRLNLRALGLAERIASWNKFPTESSRTTLEEDRRKAAELEAEKRRQAIDPDSPAGRLARAREQLKELTVAGASEIKVERAKEAVLDARREVRKGNRLREGDVLGDRYEVVECVGVGGFATVWKCYDEELKQLVAVKVLHPSHHDDGRKKERFFRGARIMKEIAHQNIVMARMKHLHCDKLL
ncbi:MAG: protein kinase [Planctomycetota bacterium]